MKSKIHEFLKEDIGSGDITSELVVPEHTRGVGRIVCKEPCVLAGIEEACMVFKELGVRVISHARDGSLADKGDIVVRVEGSARAMLAGERVALNLVMRMSGIATLTRELVDKAKRVNPKIRVAATRKTTPGFRYFEKKAVRVGGGDPHRMGLYDAVLIKNNHLRVAGGVKEALRRAKSRRSSRYVEIEVESRSQAIAAIEGGADIIMLDNFAPADARKLSKELRGLRPDIVIEISGGIKPDNIQQYAATADIISLGSLTHSVRSKDFSMRIDPGSAR